MGTANIVPPSNILGTDSRLGTYSIVHCKDCTVPLVHFPDLLDNNCIVNTSFWLLNNAKSVIDYFAEPYNNHFTVQYYTSILVLYNTVQVHTRAVQHRIPYRL